MSKGSFYSLHTRTPLRAVPKELTFVGGFLPSNDARMHEEAMGPQCTSQALEDSWGEGGTQAHNQRWVWFAYENLIITNCRTVRRICGMERNGCIEATNASCTRGYSELKSISGSGDNERNKIRRNSDQSKVASKGHPVIYDWERPLAKAVEIRGKANPKRAKEHASETPACLLHYL